MAVYFFDGYDHQRLSGKGFASDNRNYDNNNVGPRFDQVGRGGRGFCMRLEGIAPFSSNPTAVWDLPGTAEFACAAAFWCQQVPDNVSFWSFREGSTEHVGLQVSGGFLRAVRGDGTVLATSVVPVTITNPAFSHIEAQIKVDEAAGFARVWYNGEQIIDFTGDTRNGGTTGLPTKWVANCGSQGGYGPGINFDDVWITDPTGPAPLNGRLGNCVVEHLWVNGPGDVSDWTGSDGDQVDNWALIDDGSGADFIRGANQGDRDLSSLADGDTALGRPLAFAADVLAAVATTGTAVGPVREVLVGQADGELVERVASVGALTTTFVWYPGSVRNTDPDGNPWTLERLNALQVGVEVGTTAP